MPHTFYVATSNPGKLRDFAAAAESSIDTELASLPGMDRISPPPEDGSTFEENARAKAIAYSQYAPGDIVIADDSGLEVDALHGAPGVRSARYAADTGFGRSELSSDMRNNLCLMENLRDVPEGQRAARYRCVLAAARDGECIAIGEGTVDGTILDSPRGDGGFGYDPLFYLAELERTMAEIDLEQKLKLSHRGIALRALLQRLLQL